jgi:hypothetical protein
LLLSMTRSPLISFLSSLLFWLHIFFFVWTFGCFLSGMLQILRTCVIFIYLTLTLKNLKINIMDLAVGQNF